MLKTREEFAMIGFVLKTLRELNRVRGENLLDSKEEQGTYNQGYYDALLEFSTIIIKKYGLN